MSAPSETRNPQIDAYIAKAKAWREELERLRTILLESGLTEELKWDQPCYTLGGKNVCIIHGLKDACALSFLKGALLADPHGLLTRPGEHTQSGRWLKFTSAREVTEREPIVREYLREAIEAERAGREIEYKKTEDYPVPAELQAKLDGSPPFRHAWDGLTPGRQRGYLLHFAAPKQSKTRTARVEKWTPQILAGRGMHDY